jgi:UDP-N-acetylglucosamine--dolichyl-phosphate N-acetylglucosaminephosphotransferase
MSAQLSQSEVLSLLTITGAAVGVLLNTFQGDEDGNPLVASIAFSCIAFSATYSLIRWLGNTFMKAGFKGRDMGKLKKTEMLVSM